MSQALTFNDITFSPVTHQNSLWIRAAELARALGLSREDKVTQIYQRHADEFTNDMTQLIENIAEPQNEVSRNLSSGRCRIFSLRGCHLLAMFARTPVAKAFRRWVLDVLDRLAAEERARIADNVKSLPRKRGRPAMARPAAPGPAAFALPAAADIDGHLAAIREHIRRIRDHEDAIFHTVRKAAQGRGLGGPGRSLTVLTQRNMENAAWSLHYALESMEASARFALVAGRG